jgi:hypothetical protein
MTLANQLVDGDIGELEFLAHVQLDKTLLQDIQKVMTLPNYVHRRFRLDDMLPPNERSPKARKERKPLRFPSPRTIRSDYWERLDLVLFNGVPTSDDAWALQLKDYVDVTRQDSSSYEFKFWKYDFALLFARKLLNDPTYVLHGEGPSWLFGVSQSDCHKVGGEPPKEVTGMVSLKKRYTFRLYTFMFGDVEEPDMDAFDMPVITALNRGGVAYFMFAFQANQKSDALALRGQIDRLMPDAAFEFESGLTGSVLKVSTHVLEQLNILPNGAVIS